MADNYVSQINADNGVFTIKDPNAVKTVNGISPDASGNVEVQDGVQSNWNQTDTTKLDYIKNKPNLSNYLDKTYTGENKIAGKLTVGSCSTNVNNAYLHQRNVGTTGTVTNTAYNGGAFAVNSDGSVGFFHKTYTDASGNGARNSAILRFFGKRDQEGGGLQFGVNANGNVAESDYKTVAMVEDIPTKASDIGAMASTVTHLSGDVPTTRKINNKALSADITLTASDVGAATEKYVDDAITALPEPMIFKGSLGTGGTITSLPTAAATNEGFTYKVITGGTYAGQSAKVGDTFISDGTSWVLIPSGDEPSGTVTSVGLTVPTGLSVSGSPVTSSGTIAVSLSEGYTIPTEDRLAGIDNKAQSALSSAGNATAAAQAAMQTANSKQEVLVSGTNIKTINGEDILGSGNIVVSSTDPNDAKLKVQVNGAWYDIFSANASEEGRFTIPISYSTNSSYSPVELHILYQETNYQELATEAKTIIGAINELANIPNAEQEEF